MISERPRLDRFTLILIGMIFLIIALTAWPLVTVLVLSLSLAVVTLPFHRRLTRRFSDGLSAMITTVVVFTLLMLVLYATVSVLYENLDVMVGILRNLISSIGAISEDVPYLNDFADRITEALFNVVLYAAQWMSGLVFSIPFLVIELLILVLSYFLLIVRGDRIWAELTTHVPPAGCLPVKKLSKITVDTLYAVYIVSFEVALYSFLVSFPIYYLLGYEDVLLLALLTGLFQLIPVLGPQILIALLIVYAVATGDIRTALLLLFIGYPVISGVADFYLRPALMGGRVAISPVLMMIGIFGGLALLGFIGFILGPLFTALGVAAYEILIDQLNGLGEGCASDTP